MSLQSPSISLSPTTFATSGETITATVALLNRPAYHGKPAITGLTTITPKIVCNRSPAGVFPFFVQVSASETTCNAGDAFLDLHYEWNFGDPTGTEEFTDYYNNATINANQQYGPNAVYCYRNAGTYTITLTVKGKDANGTLVTASTTTINVLGVFYVFTGGATGGTFTLTINGETTATIPYTATRQELDTAIDALASMATLDFRTNHLKTVILRGDLTGTSHTITANFAGLTGATGTPELVEQIAHSSSASVVVSDLSALSAQYFDSTYDGSNGVADGTITRPYTTWAALREFMIGGSNRVCYVKRGSTFVMTNDCPLNYSYSKIRVVAYGSGAKPIIQTGGTDHHFEVAMRYGNSIGGDVVFSYVDFQHAGALTTGMFYCYASSNGTTTLPYSAYLDLYVDNCNFTVTDTGGTGNFVSWQGAGDRGITDSGFGLWNCNLSLSNNAGAAIFTHMSQWKFMVGGSIVGGYASTLALEHHIYPQVDWYQTYKYISFGTGYKSFCINTNVQREGRSSDYFVADGCDFTGTEIALDFSNADNSYGANTGHFDNVVVQFNKLHSGQASANKRYGILCYNLSRIAIRYCDFWDNFDANLVSNDVTKPTTYRIYGCRFYEGSFDVYAGQTAYFHNNYYYTVTAATPCIRFFSGATSVELWDCDGNTWYAPNTTQPFYDWTNTTYKSFTTWQGYGNDANGSQANPLWADPANGVFIDNPTVSVNWPTGFTSLEYSLNNTVWLPYTDEAAVSLPDSAARQLVYFRAGSSASSGVLSVVATSDAYSLEIDAESISASVTGSVVGSPANPSFLVFFTS